LEANVNELDEAWEQALAEARQRAHAAGRADVAEYLRLRASNDLLRKTGIEWLMSTFTTLAGHANRAGASIQISEADAHRFSIGNATMVGRLLTLTLRVRAIAIEAGWPRVPSDGFIRGGGLACARIKHLGKKSLDQELMLVRSADSSPHWMIVDKTKRQTELLEARIKSHVNILLSDDYK
jgi:hypothetical protein